MNTPTDAKLAAFTAAVTHTVIAFRPNRFDAWRNREDGSILFSGRLSFDCGHSYTWHPHGATEQPKRGDQAMCATCIGEQLEAATAGRLG